MQLFLYLGYIKLLVTCNEASIIYYLKEYIICRHNTSQINNIYINALNDLKTYPYSIV